MTETDERDSVNQARRRLLAAAAAATVATTSFTAVQAKSEGLSETQVAFSTLKRETRG